MCSKSAEAVIGFDGPLLIREVEVKNVKHIHIIRVGEREEYQIKFEVHEFIIITLIDQPSIVMKVKG